MAKLKLQGKGGQSVKKPNKRLQIGENVFISAEQHANLIQHVKDRLDWAMGSHEAHVNRYTAIDKEVSGFIRLTDEDYKRKLDNTNGEGPKPYDVSLQLSKAQIDEAVTYLLSVYFPEEGPYNAVAPEAKQEVAKGFLHRS